MCEVIVSTFYSELAGHGFLSSFVLEGWDSASTKVSGCGLDDKGKNLCKGKIFFIVTTSRLARKQIDYP
jgi:hypothetical protein